MTVIAVLCSDLHLSHTAPTARSAEPDWYAVQERVLDEIKDVAGRKPIIFAGDLFDRWNSPAELINFAIDNLPQFYAIPGQHDLPLHSYLDIRKSAYWTLVAAEVINNLVPASSGCPILIDGMWVHPFPWGFDLKPAVKEEGELKIAVAHQYCWVKGATYHPDVPGELKSFSEQLAGYDAAVFGDNHKGSPDFVWHLYRLEQRRPYATQV